MIARRDWVTTAQVAEAAGVHPTTLARWSKLGLLPERVHLNLGRRGRAFRWPPHALEQAQWVKARIDDMWTMEEIRAALERGEFKPALPTSPFEDSS